MLPNVGGDTAPTFGNLQVEARDRERTRYKTIVFSISKAMFLVGVCLLGVSCDRSRDSAHSLVNLPPCTRKNVWAEIESMAGRYRLDPRFIYALVAAESDFNPRAKNGDARGLLQLTPSAWKSVSDLNYDSQVWNWRENLQVGIDYLAQQRLRLHRENHYSVPNLVAVFHFGYQEVADRGFKIERLTPPSGELWKKLWSGEESPLPPP